jgi:hypothetical protein
MTFEIFGLLLMAQGCRHGLWRGAHFVRLWWAQRGAAAGEPPTKRQQGQDRCAHVAINQSINYTFF